MVNAQEWLEKNYPKGGFCKDERDGWGNINENYGKKREEIFELNINSKKLDGSLTLEEFVNLKKLDCSGNKLTNLKLVNLDSLEELSCNGNNLNNLIITNSSQHIASNIWYLDCSNNCLSDLDLLNALNPKKLTILHLWNNGFTAENLDCFQTFVELHKLSISNYETISYGDYEGKKANPSVHNSFSGSLKPLKNLIKLEYLYVDSTDVDGDLENLPDSIKEFYCSTKRRPESKVKNIEQGLRKFGEPRQGTYGFDFAPLLKIWKEFFNSPARKWLDKEYPENGVCQRWTPKKGEEWNNKGKKREKIKKLDVSRQDLKEGLSLKGFTDLEELDCSDNQLTNLDLRDCPNLVELKCDNNKLRDLDLFKTLSNPEKLEKIWMQNNSFLMTKNLSSLTPLVNLKTLDISGCPKTKGSLKSLEKLVKLRWLDISNTDIKEGIEHLPESIKNFYCELDYDYGSVEIAKELGKFSEGTDEKSGHTQYNLDKWRIDQINTKTASAISLEKLFVIRSNLQQFLKKWGSEDENNQTELSKLQSPEEIKKFKGLEWVEYASTATTVVGGALTLIDFSTTGGVITLIAPLVGTGASQLKSSLYDEKQKKWEEFKTDIDAFLDNYNALRGILKQLEVGKWGQVNLALKNLKDKADQFLKEYDRDENGEIDIEELTVKREKFSNELDKIRKIIKTIQNLEDKVVEYQKGDLTGKDETKVEIEEKQKKTIPTNDDDPFQKVIKELSEKIEVDGDLKERIESELTQSEITFLLKGKEEGQVFVISKIQDNIFNEILPKRMNRNYVLNSAKVEENSVEIESSLLFPKWFSSQKEAINKALELAEVKLINEQQEQIQTRANEVIEEKEKEQKVKKWSSVKNQEELIEMLGNLLLEKEIKKIQENKSDKSTGKFTICNLCHLAKEHLNNKKTKIDEQLKENDQLIAQIQIPPK
jgi:hypothetical protein